MLPLYVRACLDKFREHEGTVSVLYALIMYTDIVDILCQ